MWVESSQHHGVVSDVRISNCQSPILVREVFSVREVLSVREVFSVRKVFSDI